MTANQTGLKIMLQHGHFIGMVCQEEQARQLMEAWKADRLPKIVEGTSPAQGGLPWRWAVRADAIVGMHTFVLAEQGLLQAGQLPGYIGPGTSGM